jgi:diapolycopene oxygenase
MNLLPYIQWKFDLWYVKDGMFAISKGMTRLIQQLPNIQVKLNANVVSVQKDHQRLTSVTLSNGQVLETDIIVSNMEAIPFYEKITKESPSFIKTMNQKFHPACSGFALHLGTNRVYPQLAHHNFFYSDHQKKHFHTVFRKHQLPPDPTIYLVAASRTDPTVAPEGCDCLKILPHIPYIDDKNPLTREDYAVLKERVIDKLERMGLTDLRKHIVFEHFWTPLDIREQYGSNKGSIYGVVSDRFKNLAFKAPKQSTKYPNLFFVGGSVNPGGGMPMVVLCGQNVAKSVVAWDQP